VCVHGIECDKKRGNDEEKPTSHAQSGLPFHPSIANQNIHRMIGNYLITKEERNKPSSRKRTEKTQLKGILLNFLG
jgi:hypothetical protein